MPQGRVHQVRQRRISLAGQPLRMPRRLAPVLAALVELVRRCPHADPGDHDVVPGPGVSAARMTADRQVLDDADAHPGRPRRVLGGGELPVREPLQPGVEQGLAGQPDPLGCYLGRAHRAQRLRPRPPVRPVDLGQRAPQAPVLQRLPLTVPVGVELGAALRGHRLPVDDLQSGPFGPPDPIPVEQLAGGVAGPQRRREGVDTHPVPRREPRVLGNVFDPQVQRADETPAHRQIRGLAQRWQRLTRVQRVDQDEPGPQVTGAPRGQVGQVAQVPEPPGLAGAQRVELHGEAPGPVHRAGDHGPVRCPGRVRDGGNPHTLIRGFAQRGQDGIERPLAHLDPPPVPVAVAGRHPVGLGPPSGLVARHPSMIRPSGRAAHNPYALSYPLVC